MYRDRDRDPAEPHGTGTAQPPVPVPVPTPTDRPVGWRQQERGGALGSFIRSVPLTTVVLPYSHQTKQLQNFLHTPPPSAMAAVSSPLRGEDAHKRHS